jgi:hypothetical protein
MTSSSDRQLRDRPVNDDAGSTQQGGLPDGLACASALSPHPDSRRVDERKPDRLAPRGIVRGHVVVAVNTLRSRLAEPWSLDALADEVHLSRSQLVRAFDPAAQRVHRVLRDRGTRPLPRTEWRDTWAQALTGVTLVSDGYLPFRDNVDHAAESGVTRIIEPGGSIRTPEVAAAAAELGIVHLQTGLRLFHH